MPVTSPHIWYPTPGSSGYDLRKTQMWCQYYKDPTKLWVTFITDPLSPIIVDAVAFNAAKQASLDEEASGGGSNITTTTTVTTPGSDSLVPTEKAVATAIANAVAGTELPKVTTPIPAATPTVVSSVTRGSHATFAVWDVSMYNTADQRISGFIVQAQVAGGGTPVYALVGPGPQYSETWDVTVTTGALNLVITTAEANWQATVTTFAGLGV